MSVRDLASRLGVGAGRTLRRGWGMIADRPDAARAHVSLGSHCHMAAALRDAGLRTWSGPFDWLFSAPGLVSDCLEDDFAAFLDPAQLESVPLAERVGPDVTRGRHRTYGPRHGLPFIFNHHDPAVSAADRAHFERAVARLRRVLGDPAGHRFYLLATRSISDAEVARLCDGLARRARAHHLTVFQLAAEHGPSRARPRPSARPDLAIVDLVTRGPSRGTGFDDPGDDALLLGALREAAGRPDREVRGAQPRGQDLEIAGDGPAGSSLAVSRR